MFRRALLLLTAVAVLGFAQRPGGPPKTKGQPHYDPATETTFTGTVDEVKEHAHPGMARMGTHLTVKTVESTFDVHLGPSSFLKKENFTFTKGDVITVTGSKVPYQGAEAILAREVKKGDKTLTLRNAKGMPRWGRGGNWRSRS